VGTDHDPWPLGWTKLGDYVVVEGTACFIALPRNPGCPGSKLLFDIAGREFQVLGMVTAAGQDLASEEPRVPFEIGRVGSLGGLNTELAEAGAAQGSTDAQEQEKAK
jgi:hypothetical protein